MAHPTRTGSVMGVRSWWRAQVGEAEDDARAARCRVLPQLQPLLDAERARGNEPDGPWRKVMGQYPSERWDERSLHFPHDVEALRVEFDLDDAPVDVTDRGFGEPWQSSVLGGSVEGKRSELVAAWEAQRAQWWREWKAGPQHRRRVTFTSEEMSRTVASMVPVIAAELARENPVTDYWVEAPAWSPDAGWLVRHLLHPVDEQALAAQFVFDDEVRLLSDRVVSVRDHAVLVGGHWPLTRYDLKARRQWHDTWQAGPQQRVRLSQVALGDQ